MRRRRRVMVIMAVRLLMLSLTVLAGCQAPFQRGSVRGTLEISGGPPPGEHPEPGKVVLLNKLQRAIVITVPKGGAFAVNVPAGTYRVYGSIPKYGYTTKVCFSTPPSIKVAASSSNKIVVGCAAS